MVEGLGGVSAGAMRTYEGLCAFSHAVSDEDLDQFALALSTTAAGQLSSALQLLGEAIDDFEAKYPNPAHGAVPGVSGERDRGAVGPSRERGPDAPIPVSAARGPGKGGA